MEREGNGEHVFKSNPTYKMQQYHIKYSNNNDWELTTGWTKISNGSGFLDGNGVTKLSVLTSFHCS